MADYVKSNLIELKKIFGQDETVIFREFNARQNPSTHYCVVFVDHLVNADQIQNQIIAPLMQTQISEPMEHWRMLDFISKEVITIASLTQESELSKIVELILAGNTALFINDFYNALILSTTQWTDRAVDEPSSEKTLFGPREGFTENIDTNLSLIRRRLRTSNLKLEFMQFGAETKTKICICYIENIVDKKILEELHRRLDKIDLDGVLDVAYLAELITDDITTSFRNLGDTERPDVVAGKLLEGRIAILCDGTPIALTLPFIFLEYFNVNEDYYNNYFLATFNRAIRWLGFFLTSSVPAIYVALVTYHQEMIPTQLLLSISASRQGVPFPTIVEAIAMLIVFEIIRETSVRIPTAVGQTISIVGTLVIGQAAVEAKLVSAPMIIVAAITAITSYIVPKMQIELIITRFIFLFLSAFLGLYGYIFGCIVMFIHLSSLRSFGIPYMLNIASLNKSDIKDTIIRVPWGSMKKRPELIAAKNRVRKGEE